MHAQVDKLVQLLESPVFVLLRLQLLDAAQPFQPALLKSLYGERNRLGFMSIVSKHSYPSISINTTVFHHHYHRPPHDPPAVDGLPHP